MNIVSIYIVCKDKAEALRIGEVLVKEKLAACVNIGQEITSIYEWEGEVKQDTEVQLWAKTTREKAMALMAKVTTLHSYEVPCMLIFEASGGYLPYLKWVASTLE